MDLIEGGVSEPINHWYYRHKFHFLKQYLRSRTRPLQLADIGAGSALFSKQLLADNDVARVIAVDTGYEKELGESNSKLSFVRELADWNSDVYLMTDVLEHIENDSEFLSGFVGSAKPGSKFMITVPAHMSLWSGHDVYLKHFRRYTKRELVDLVSTCGLEVETARYIFSTVFPIAYIQRRFLAKESATSQMQDHSKLASTVLRLLLWPDRFLPILPFGVSLYLVASKELIAFKSAEAECRSRFKAANQGRSAA